MGCITTLSSGRFYSVKKIGFEVIKPFSDPNNINMLGCDKKGFFVQGLVVCCLHEGSKTFTNPDLVYLWKAKKPNSLTVKLIAEDIEIAFYYFLSSVSFYLPMQKRERNKHCYNCVQKLMTSRMFLLLASHFGLQWFTAGPQEMVRMLYVYHIWSLRLVV